MCEAALPIGPAAAVKAAPAAPAAPVSSNCDGCLCEKRGMNHMLEPDNKCNCVLPMFPAAETDACIN